MNLKKAWIWPQSGKKIRYGLRTGGGIAGIVALMVVLVCGGSFVGLYLDLPKEIFSLALVCGATALATALALHLGRQNLRAATIFFLTEDDRLFVLDARTLCDHEHGILGYAAATRETQKFLRKMEKNPFVPAGADEILKVENIKENRTHYTIRCQVRHPNRQVSMRTCFLMQGTADQELLLQQLERREMWENKLEPTDNRNPIGILISTLALVVLVALCVLSHPAQAILPQPIYFPCLGASVIALFFVVYFILRQRRGE